jgi:hypothetical protein
MASVTEANPRNHEEQGDNRPPLNIEAFQRLRWKVFDDIQDIQVTEDAGDMDAIWRPFAGHSMSFEFSTQPPVSSMKVDLGSFNHNDFWGDACLDPPVPTLIKHDDRSYLTMKDFVEQFGKYIKDLKEIVVDVIGTTENVWFTDIGLNRFGDSYSVHFAPNDLKWMEMSWAHRAKILQHKRLGTSPPANPVLGIDHLRMQVLQATADNLACEAEQRMEPNAPLEGTRGGNGVHEQH